MDMTSQPYDVPGCKEKPRHLKIYQYQQMHSDIHTTEHGSSDVYSRYSYHNRGNPTRGYNDTSSVHRETCLRARNESLQAREASSDPSSITGPILAGIGVIIAVGSGGVGSAVALAALRLSTATFYGAATLGTGYVAVKGGKIVLQKARPGILATIRAANRAASDARTSAHNMAVSSAEGVDGMRVRAAEGAQATVQAGVDVVGSISDHALGLGQKVAGWFPRYQVLFDPRIAGQGFYLLAPIRAGQPVPETTEPVDGINGMVDGEFFFLLHDLPHDSSSANVSSIVSSYEAEDMEETAPDEGEDWLLVDLPKPETAHLRT